MLLAEHKEQKFSNVNFNVNHLKLYNEQLPYVEHMCVPGRHR